MTPRPSDAAALARRALDLASSDAAQAGRAARQALALAAGRDPVAEATARRALGLLALYANDLPEAIASQRAAIDVAESHGLSALAGEARMSLAPALLLSGDAASALAEADLAAAVLSGLPRARLEAQRAAMLEKLGRPEEALAAYARALPRLRRAGDRLWEARARHNRGNLHLIAGDLAQARADLMAADAILAELGLPAGRAHACHHLGRLEALSGDLPAALAWFARADELNAELGRRDPLGLIDRCVSLLPARLGEEARDAAEAAIAALEGSGDEQNLAEARLAHAEACLLTLDPAAAAESAALARASFRRRRLPRWAALAGAAAVRARWTGGERTPDLLAAARASAHELEAATWVEEAVESRLLAGRLAAGLGRVVVARRELSEAGRSRRRGSALARSRAWEAEARQRLLGGDRPGGRAAVRAGLRLVDAHRATLGATELRARAAGHGTDLAGIGLRLAVDDGDPAAVFSWSERWRAGALQPVGTRVPRDPALRQDLAELRRVSAEIDAATLAGEGVEALRRRQVELEAAVTRRLRTARGAASVSPRPPSVRDIAGALDGAALLELSEVDGRLYGVVVAQRARLAALGSAAEVREELDAARFALRRLALGRGSAMALDAARVALAQSTWRLDDLLLGPVRSWLGSRPLVLVPTAALHVVPWSTLPSLVGRPVTVAPSAGQWRRARDAPAHGTGRVALVAGPRLAGAGPEIAGLARRYPEALRLTGRRATVDAARAALDGAGLAHVAAHGRFRADNPLFSTIELADGPLTVHDLEDLHRPPGTLVLSACESGLSAVHAGDELLGLAASLLGLGTRTLVASLLPVPDDATRALMLAFHRHLRAGATVAEALATAQAGASAGDHGAVAAAASFVCFGAS